ncbi:unnamed protein product [Lampetra planeri]
MPSSVSCGNQGFRVKGERSQVIQWLTCSDGMPSSGGSRKTRGAQSWCSGRDPDRPGPAETPTSGAEAGRRLNKRLDPPCPQVSPGFRLSLSVPRERLDSGYGSPSATLAVKVTGRGAAWARTGGGEDGHGPRGAKVQRVVDSDSDGEAKPPNWQRLRSHRRRSCRCPPPRPSAALDPPVSRPHALPAAAAAAAALTPGAPRLETCAADGQVT